MPQSSSAKPISALIVGRPDSWRERAAAYLRSSSITVETAPTEAAALSLTARRGFAIVLVDLQLPGEMGFSVCRRLAGEGDIRLIAVGVGTHEADAVVALELGADDYVSRGTPMRELLARVRAQARRLGDTGAPKFTFAFCGFEWDLRRRRISAPDGSALTLSSCEISLLVAFLQSAGRELSRDELKEMVSRDGVDVSVRAIDSHVSRLRRKLGEHGAMHLIGTVYGVGYRWAGADQEDAPAAAVADLGARQRPAVAATPAAPADRPAAARAAG